MDLEPQVMHDDYMLEFFGAVQTGFGQLVLDDNDEYPAHLLTADRTFAVRDDDTIVLNSDKWLHFGQDAVTTLEHEISEGVFGRLGSLGVSLAGWQPMDLFRFTADGARDYSGGADGQTTFFGVDAAHVGAMAFHNALNALGQNDGSGFNDWDTSADAFGPGGPGVIGDLSATDLQILDILGWTPARPVPGPAMRAPNGSRPRPTPGGRISSR